MLPKHVYCKVAPESCAGRAAEAFISTGNSSEGCRTIFPSGTRRQSGGYSVCISNVQFQGTGTISSGGSEAEGWAWWDCARPLPQRKCWRPHLLVLSNVEGASVDGLTLLNAPNHNIELSGVVGARVKRLTILAPYLSPNTDGVNFYGGWDSLMQDCVINNGDDCVSVVPIGLGLDLCVSASTTDVRCSGGHVMVRNVSCSGGHGLSIGGVRHGNVHNVTFSNITATGGQPGSTQDEVAGGGCRIKCYPNSTGLVSGIRYEHMRFFDVFLPVQLLGHYCPFPCNTPDGNTSVRFANISFHDVVGTGKQENTVVEIKCSSLAPCENITLSGVELTAKFGKPGQITCENVASVSITNSSPSACND